MINVVLYLENGAHGLGLQLAGGEEELQVLVQQNLLKNISHQNTVTTSRGVQSQLSFYLRR
jgi:hypothetical protein